jgi:hypothetical protein
MEPSSYHMRRVLVGIQSRIDYRLDIGASVFKATVVSDKQLEIYVGDLVESGEKVLVFEGFKFHIDVGPSPELKTKRLTRFLTLSFDLTVY